MERLTSEQMENSRNSEITSTITGDDGLAPLTLVEIGQAKGTALDVVSAVFEQLRHAPTPDQPARTVPLFFPNGIDSIDFIVKIGADKNILDVEVKIAGPKK